MLPQEIIRKKREKMELTPEEITFFIRGVTDRSIADSQTAALTMAIFLNGMTKEETTSLTLCMRDSGEVMHWSDLYGPVVDKHSSGGVGDKVSLMLAPMVAACGGFVPMISGRGLGHTGGTLDKFEAIPGYITQPDNKLFHDTVKEVGCAIIGQTGNLAPADKKIYAIRDVCATVESIPLITASILSKKLAAGLDGLVMDLKCGNGAFMDNLDNARALARSIVNVANAAGTKTKALITDMNQVLGTTAGNAVEVKEAVDYLKGKNVDPRLHEITMNLCTDLLVQAGLFDKRDEAWKALQKNLDNGTALEKFAKMVSKLGGPVDFVENPDKYLPKAKIIEPLFSPQSGYVQSMNTRNIGLSVIELKGGRSHPEQEIDHTTGYSNFCQIGDKLDKNKPIAYIHAQTEDDYNMAAEQLFNNIKIGEEKPKVTPTIIEVVE